MRNLIIGLILVSLLFVVGCAKEDVKFSSVSTTTTLSPTTTSNNLCPSTCADSNDCTIDKCGAETGYMCQHILVDNCCGNNKCETGETYSTCSGDCPKPELETELAKLMANGDKVQSYRYDHYEGKLERFTYYRMGDKVKVVLVVQRNPSPGVYYDEVLLDLTKKTAIGFCGHECAYNHTVDAPYDDFIRLNPTDIADSLIVGTVTPSSNVWGDKPSTTVTFKDGDNGVKVWVWNHYSLPLIYEVKDPQNNFIQRIEFRNMVVNDVKETDLTIPKGVVTS